MKFTVAKRSTLNELQTKLESTEKQTNQAIAFLSDLRANKESPEIPAELAESALGKALTSISQHFREVSLSQEKQNWINAGMARFGDILRNKEGLTLRDLADEVIRSLVEYIGANQGAMFLLSKDTIDADLELLACYAYGRKKHLTTKIGLGEGLAGQCVLEKESIYLKQVPENYVKITSGLGAATPREVFLTPLMINEDVYGVIELASFREFDTYKIEFIKKASQNIAASIKNAQENDKIRDLLTASQQQAEELRAQEEEMRQNMEELQATQEEMERKSHEILKNTAEMQGLLKGIDATMATIEFTPEGTVVSANQRFLEAMKYSLSEIKGRHHRIFVPDEIASGTEYQIFWKKLSRGEAITGLFERISSDGKKVWLNAIYNPILDASGSVAKVVKFASDVTQQQEILAETKGIVEAVNATMATIEFNPDGTILKANANFLQVMKQTQANIKGKHHRMFVPNDIADTDEYKSFWTKLSEGQPLTGVFKRVDSTGEEVWLNAIYNPITDASGRVTKVVKFATRVAAPQSR